MNKIKLYRKQLNMTQKNLAQKTGVTQQAVVKWEKGEMYPRAEKLMELAKILNCKIDELLE